jgi:ABC-2 type transport system ATP-binding protein
MSIFVSNLVKTYGNQVAVNNISFRVAQGEIVGFLGPNGAGKSTTMKMITGYLPPDSGTAMVGNIDVAKDTIAAKKKIGYLAEANPLYFDMYVKEYLEFIAGIHQVANKTQQIKSVIELTGLQVEQNKKTGQLSKGYKQRVGLAAALIHDPEVLILDEPTSGLDPNQIIEIRNVIKAQGKNKTVLFSSHILQEVQAICDRVIIINKGTIVANDRLANLVHSGADKQTIRLTIKENIPKSIFEQLPDIISVVYSGLSGQGHQWQFETNRADEVKKSILKITVEKNLNIVSLQTESQSLEEIFKSLTT